MCGITGIYNVQTKQHVDSSVLTKMTASLRHRGPDEEGFFVKDNIGLGMARLSIIDLSGGKQPIYNEDKTICVVFNGEVINGMNPRASPGPITPQAAGNVPLEGIQNTAPCCSQ